jgi:hypothetical protein
LNILLVTIGTAIFLALIVMIMMLLFKKNESKHEKEKFIPTTQDRLPIDYIRSGIVKLKNGGYRMLVELPSINIELMEMDEREIILEQYRKILNSVDFPFQFLQQSRVVDISEYLTTLENTIASSSSLFIQSQLKSYTNFLVDLVKTRSVLTKKFYLIIPYDEVVKKVTSKQKKSQPKVETVEENGVYEEEKRFEKSRKQLIQRASLIERSFRRFDINPKILNDKELLDLFYTSYNKDRAVYQPLKDYDPIDYTSMRVEVSKKRSVKNGN